ncbi:cell division protein FtsQ/DivIB [Veillonella agrestimuris]|uniref:cell division protein FtsQ/DivIB n=1 Tax=Veillonella agrestimuris TaxID=2941340 RepID=UPI00203CB278|nr:FtsQ-type POTRA domain-containing protein [Veillonella agrestimuris]
MDDMNHHPSNSGEMDHVKDANGTAPVASSEPRLVNTEERERLLFRKKVLKIGLVVAVILIALFTLPIPLGSLKVTGTQKVTLQDVEIAGNIEEPINILHINTDTLKRRLANDLRIEEAHISYELPLTMVVQIVERKAMVTVPAQFGYLALDQNGQVIVSEDAIEDTSVPIISGVKGGNILLGDFVKDEPILQTLTYLQNLDEETFKQIAEINVGDPNHILAYTVSGIQIRIGNGNNLKEKAELTQSMLKDLIKSQGIVEYIDVNPAAPYIKTDTGLQGSISTGNTKAN